jgi:hypothetical protein
MGALRQGEIEIALYYMIDGPEASDFVQDFVSTEEIGLFCAPDD